MLPASVSRRQVLSAAGLLGAATLSGCSRLGTDSPSALLTLELYAEKNTLRNLYVYDLTETQPPWDETAFRAALNGSEYTLQYRHPFPSGIEEPAYARHNGTYYRLDAIVVDEAQAIRPVLRLHRVGRTDELGSIPDHLPSSDLPDADRHAVQIAILAARARDNRGGVPWELVQRGGYVYRDPDGIANSTILGSHSPAHVEYRDIIWRIETTRETFYEPVYRPDVDPVTTSESELEAILRARLVDTRLDPNALSTEELELLRTAMGEGLTASPPFSPPLKSLLRKMGHRPYLDGNITNDADVGQVRNRFLKYGDTYYRYRLTLEEAEA